MRTLRAITLLALLLLAMLVPPPAAAQGGLTVTDRGVFVVFPDRISFNAHIVSASPITQVVLEYGVDKRTCGDVTARAFPEFTPGTTVEASWTWEMLGTGSEPPGATIWYRWRATDSAGNTAVSPDMRATWIDKSYDWHQISRDDLTLHWYSGEPAFAEDLLSTAIDGLARLKKFTGVRPQSPIDLYIYGTTQQMQDAILYEPNWTGGVAYPANNITIIGISPAYLEWGRRTIVHELTHLIVGQITFSCGENVPTWLDEGMAVYAEGGLDDRSQFSFDDAVSSNSLLSVRSISNGFSQHPALADLAYSQSYEHGLIPGADLRPGEAAGPLRQPARRHDGGGGGHGGLRLRPGRAGGSLAGLAARRPARPGGAHAHRRPLAHPDPADRGRGAHRPAHPAHAHQRADPGANGQRGRLGRGRAYGSAHGSALAAAGYRPAPGGGRPGLPDRPGPLWTGPLEAPEVVRILCATYVPISTSSHS